MSGVEILGAVASAAQLTDLGIRLLSHISRLCSQFLDHPHVLLKRQHGVEQLVQIAKMIQSTSFPDTDIIHSILEGGVEDARALLAILEPLSPRKNDSKAQRGWKALCGIAKETQVLDLLRQIEERKGALLLCIAVANSKLLSTMDQSIIDLSASAQDAFYKVPSIQQTVEHISGQLQELVVAERAGRPNHPGRRDDSSSMITAVELALPGLDDRLSEIRSLQNSTLQLMETIRKLLQCSPRGNGIDFVIDSPHSPYQSSTLKSLRHRSGNLATQGSIQSLGLTNNSEQATERSFIVPVSYNPLFTGRANIITMIKAFYFSERREQKRLVLTGLGGVGKTQIATAFTYESYADEYYSTVLWVFAINREELLKSLTQIAKSLGLYPEIATLSSPGSVPPLALALLRWLSRDHAPRWLLIFDNLDDLDSFDITAFFPNVPWGDILITSRRKQAERLGYSIAVDIMDSDDAVELLYKCSGIPRTEDTAIAVRLTEALGFLPLALDQAGAYISEQCLDMDGYMDLYAEGRAHLLRHRPPRAVWSYEETVFTTWEISFAAVSKLNTLAAKLLDVAAFFHSDDVPLARLCPLTQDLQPGQRLLLRDFLDFIKTRLDYSQFVGAMCEELKVSKMQVRQAIGRLASLSLVRQKTETHSVSIHPLVHLWLRERQSNAQRRENARMAICLVLHALINAYDLSQFADAQVIYPYLFICLEHAHTIPQLLDATELQRVGACIIAVDSWVPFSIDPGTLSRADRFYEFVGTKKAEAEWSIPNAMLAMRHALRLKSIGHRRETSEHCVHYLKTFQQRSRFDKMYAACMARTAAPCSYRVGDYDGAEHICSYIDDTLDSTGTMLARKQLVLGAIKIDRGLPLEAEALLSSCASELLRGIGNEHFLLSVWYQLMASCYMSQGRYKEAEETVLEQLNVRLNQLQAGKIEFSFSDYELVEVYARILRKQQRYVLGRTFLVDFLARISSKKAKPERSLGELSLVLTQLDEITWIEVDTAPATSHGSQQKIEALISIAHDAYKAAAAAYELEWNRGTWVFKHFHATVGEYEQRLRTTCGIGGQQQESSISELE